jgi:predicted RNA-binding protein with PUA-like domain
MRHWLMKSEPDVFSIDDLKRRKTSLWDGVRNYQARNFMTNDMAIGDAVLFYHSNAEPPGVAGLARVVGEAQPDPTQFERKSEYFEPRARRDRPVWYCVRVGFEERFDRVISLDEIRATPALKDMLLLRKGQRLSIQPVSERDFALLVKMGRSS